MRARDIINLSKLHLSTPKVSGANHRDNPHSQTHNLAYHPYRPQIHLLKLVPSAKHKSTVGRLDAEAGSTS